MQSLFLIMCDHSIKCTTLKKKSKIKKELPLPKRVYCTALNVLENNARIYGFKKKKKKTF